jgi:hypothetical protein
MTIGDGSLSGRGRMGSFHLRASGGLRAVSR